MFVIKYKSVNQFQILCKLILIIPPLKASSVSQIKQDYFILIKHNIFDGQHNSACGQSNMRYISKYNQTFWNSMRFKNWHKFRAVLA